MPIVGGEASGNAIVEVANYSALPAASTVTGELYAVIASQGTAWLPGSLGGTYYPKGLYYSDGSSWVFTETPYNATQATVDAGTNDDQFITSLTFNNSSQLANLVPYTGANQNVDLGTNDLIFGSGSGILLNNSSRLREGTIDAGFGGSKGIAQICAVGYELKWEAGRLYVMDGNGVLIRHSLYNFNIAPSVNDDYTKGYYVGSLWTLDDGTVYTCSDSTTGAAVWDLNSGFVPYTGATSDVDLGEYELKAGQIELDQSPTGTAGVAVIRWNDTIGSSETTLKGGSVVLKNGVDLVARIVNKVVPNTTLTKAAYQVVKVSGAQGQRLAVDFAQGDVDLNSADTIGVVTETIATNQEGFILTVGQIEEINTTGSLQSETWADGDVLYLSPTVAGAMTNVKPTGLTGHIVVLGYVEYAHAVHGKIYIKIMNGWELDELHNVYINPSTLADNDVLQYESASSLWKNKPIVTPNNSASNLFNYYNFI